MARRKNQDYSELGFGTKTNAQRSRYINKDGSFNIERIELSNWNSTSIYHSLITMHWRKFNTIVFIYFMCINLLFACLYYFVDIDGLNGITYTSAFGKFMDAFFFSTQTFTTLGFGRISPSDHVTSAIAAIESLIGLLGFALATGLLYGRFSRPVAKLMYSERAIIAPFKDGKAFQFRVANKMRNSQLTDMECRVTVAKLEIENGVPIKRFRTLELEIGKILFFPMAWTVNHPIDENSPIYGMSLEDMKNADVEFLISMIGFDDTFSQTVSTRYSYTYEELSYGAKFKSIFSSRNGRTSQDLNKLSDYEPFTFS